MYVSQTDELALKNKTDEELMTGQKFSDSIIVYKS